MILLRQSFRIVSTLLQNEPKKIVYSNRELIPLWLAISYIFTYIFYS